MWRLLTLAACVHLAAGACFLPNSVQGQDEFQAVNVAYVECKKVAVVDEEKLCQCAQSQWNQADGCDYAWIVPWRSTVFRDKQKFCGGSSGSFGSSLSGSDQSMPSSQTSSDNSGSSQVKLTIQQKLFFGALAVCACLCCCGICGVIYTMQKGKGKKNKQREYYDDDEQDDYEAQQYDQGYGGDANYEGRPTDGYGEPIVDDLAPPAGAQAAEGQIVE